MNGARRWVGSRNKKQCSKIGRGRRQGVTWKGGGVLHLFSEKESPANYWLFYGYCRYPTLPGLLNTCTPIAHCGSSLLLLHHHRTQKAVEKNIVWGRGSRYSTHLWDTCSSGRLQFTNRKETCTEKACAIADLCRCSVFGTFSHWLGTRMELGVLSFLMCMCTESIEASGSQSTSIYKRA